MPRFLVLIAAVLFGTTGTAQALADLDGSPLAVGAARLLVGAAMLLLAARLAGSAGAGSWSPKALAALAVGVAGYQLAFFAAVADTGVAVGTVVALGSAPALAGLLGRVVDGTPLDRRWAACTALATAGVLLLVLGAGGDAEVSPPGILLALVAGGSYAAYTVASKRLLADGHAPEEVMARGFGLAAVALLPVLAVKGGDIASTDGVLLALYLGAIPTALAYVLFARGLKHLGAGETATLTLAEPLTAALLGVLILDERPGAVAIVGAALVLAGLAALAAPRRTPARPLAAAEAA
ncbi:MAG TPA: EamA family transporter [Solirubrobacteraceae bacterium]|nr:EamA family transporter [Solirubrobacteraceae bacterium]